MTRHQISTRASSREAPVLQLVPSIPVDMQNLENITPLDIDRAEARGDTAALAEWMRAALDNGLQTEMEDMQADHEMELENVEEAAKDGEQRALHAILEAADVTQAIHKRLYQLAVSPELNAALRWLAKGLNELSQSPDLKKRLDSGAVALRVQKEKHLNEPKTLEVRVKQRFGLSRDFAVVDLGSTVTRIRWAAIHVPTGQDVSIGCGYNGGTSLADAKAAAKHFANVVGDRGHGMKLGQEWSEAPDGGLLFQKAADTRGRKARATP